MARQAGRPRAPLRPGGGTLSHRPPRPSRCFLARRPGAAARPALPRPGGGAGHWGGGGWEAAALHSCSVGPLSAARAPAPLHSRAGGHARLALRSRPSRLGAAPAPLPAPPVRARSPRSAPLARPAPLRSRPPVPPAPPAGRPLRTAPASLAPS